MGRYGFWSRLTDIEDSVNEFVDISNNPLYAFPSDIGRINPNTQLETDFLSYLIDFRTIVESYMTIEEKLYQINDVMSQSSNIIYLLHSAFPMPAPNTAPNGIAQP
jgi:hypothetical protein